MPRFAKLCFATALATLVMIGLGGLVRATDSGLGCPDWPGCFGRLVPPNAAKPWIEHTHRLWALVVLGCIVALVVVARRIGQPRGVRRATWALFAVWWSQAVLGAVVVWLRLHAASVSAHLTLALTMLAAALVLGFDALRRARPERPPAAPVSRLAAATAATAALQMVLGSVVTGVGAGLAYSTFPSFNGRAVPAFHQPYAWKEATHVAHRLLALGLTVLVVWLAVRVARSTDLPAFARPLAFTAVGLVLVQIVLGVLNLRWRLSAFSVVPHMVVGAALFGALVALSFGAHWLARAEEPAEVPTSVTEARHSVEVSA